MQIFSVYSSISKRVHGVSGAKYTLVIPFKTDYTELPAELKAFITSFMNDLTNAYHCHSLFEESLHRLPNGTQPMVL